MEGKLYKLVVRPAMLDGLMTQAMNKRHKSRAGGHKDETVKVQSEKSEWFGCLWKRDSE